MKKVTVEEYLAMNKVQRKVVDVKNAVRRKVEWVKEHPEEAAAIAGGVATLLGVATKGAKTVMRTHNLHKEQQLKDRYIYDRSLGMYLHTKRKLTNKDYVTINKRRQDGEKLSDILSNMGVLD